MITITQPKTQLDQNLEAINEPMSLIENSARAICHNLNHAMDMFWNLPDEQLLEIMNFKGPVEMNKIFTAHARNAENMNSLLADRGVSPLALIGMRKPVVFNGETGLFEIDLPVGEDPIVEEPVI
jgi:hypothetical protein